VTKPGPVTEARSIVLRVNGQTKVIEEDQTDRSAITPEKATGVHPTESDKTEPSTLSGKPRINCLMNRREKIPRKRMNAPRAVKWANSAGVLSTGGPAIREKRYPGAYPNEQPLIGQEQLSDREPMVLRLIEITGAVGEPQTDRRSTVTEKVSERHRTGRHEMATKIYPTGRPIDK